MQLVPPNSRFSYAPPPPFMHAPQTQHRAASPYAYAYAAPPVYRQAQPVYPRTQTPPVLYVLASFGLMMMMAAVLSVVGSVAALTFLDGMNGQDDEAVETAPSAALNR